jgi:4'-phosphopantetheinyl transferase
LVIHDIADTLVDHLVKLLVPGCADMEPGLVRRRDHYIRLSPTGGYGGIVDVWVADISSVEVADLDLGILDEAERERAGAFVRRADRVRYLVAHLALRRLLAARIGQAPQELRYGRLACVNCGGSHGRPVLADPEIPVHFSLSHGGDLIAVALSKAPLGVDVEPFPQRPALAELARVLHPGEQQDLAAVPDTDRPAAFARLWTRKEAYLKALGTGLSRDLAVDYLGESGRAPAPVGWTTTTLDAPPGHAAAVCCANSGPVRLHLDQAEHIVAA